MAAASEVLSPQIRAHIDAFAKAWRPADVFMEWQKVEQAIHDKFNAPSTAQKGLAYKHFMAKLAEIRATEAKAKEAWFNGPMK